MNKKEKKCNKKHKKQRIERGFSYSDIWNFDTYLAEVIAKGCEELAKLDHGYPIGFLEETEKGTEEEWNKILLDIAKGFRCYFEEQFNWGVGSNMTEFRDEINDPESDYNKAWDLLRKHFGSLWD